MELKLLDKLHNETLRNNVITLRNKDLERRNRELENEVKYLLFKEKLSRIKEVEDAFSGTFNSGWSPT